MTLHDPKHPFWPVVRTVAILGALVLILKMNAAHFDVTEIKSIVTAFLAIIGVEAGANALQRRSQA